MDFSSLDGGDDDEHNAVSLVAISRIDTTQSEIFDGTAPFDGVMFGAPYRASISLITRGLPYNLSLDTASCWNSSHPSIRSFYDAIVVLSCS